MKRLLLPFITMFLCFAAGAQQCPAPVITASGPTTLCPGGSVTLFAPPADKVWTRKADLAGPARIGAVGFSIGNKGYIGTGGTSLTSGMTKDFWEYDPATNAWTQKADFSGSARSYATGFSIGGKGYVGTGTDGGSFAKDFWEYDPATNTWARKADFGGPARSNATGFSIGSKGYVGTGTNGSNPVKDFWEYSPAADAWTQKADFGGTARAGATGFSSNGKGYIGTGYEGGTSYKKDFWAYDPVTNGWTQKADFGGAARGYAAGFSIDSMGYIGTGSYTSSSRGGVITYNSFNDFWEYNSAANAWTQKADYGGGGPERAAGFTIGSRGYVGTGRVAVDPYTGVALKDFWEYGPGTTYKWSPYGQTTTSITVTTAGNYTLTTTNAQGCSATSAAIVVTVSAPVIPVITESGPTTICPGSSITLSAPAGNTFAQKADFAGSSRMSATGFSIGSKGYMGTGYAGSYYKDFWEYDPVKDVWTQKADFGGPARQDATGFSIGSKGYMGTGYASSYYKDFWEYDPAGNTWIQKADFGGSARYGATGLSVNGKGYIGTGNDGSNKRDFWEYDPATNAWMQKADFGGSARYAATGFSIANKGYIGTGATISYNKDFWEYDPATNAWTRKADFGGSARYGATGLSMNGKGYIGTGNEGNLFGDDKRDFWEYDPVTNTWTQKIDFGGIARRDAIGFSIGSNGYIGAGTTGPAPLRDFWEYGLGSYSYSWSPGGQTTPSITISAAGTYTLTTTNALGCSATSAATVVTVMPPVAPVINTSGSATICPGSSVTLFAPAGNTWTQKADLGGSARAGAAGFSIGSKGYIGTGSDSNGRRKDFWEYDPATNAWTQKADFGGSVRSDATGFSIANKGYIGTGNNGSYFKDFWEYDPVSNIWTQKADFGGTARNNATGFSIGKKGYIGMGYDGIRTSGASGYVGDFWEYDPAANAWTQKAGLGIAGAVEGVTAFSIGNKGYFGTGNNGGGRAGPSSGYVRDFWEYDPVTNTWAQKASFSGSARQDAAGFSIGTKGYIGTGINAGGSIKDLWEYDPSTNQWTQKVDFGGSARAGATGFSIGSRGYIGTGYNGGYQKDFWEYDPGYTYAWSPGGQTTPSIAVTTPGNYTVTTTNVLGCSATSAAITVRVLSGTVYVDSSRAASGDGSSWGTAYKELREALRDAGQCTGTTAILVAKGTYKPTDDNNFDSTFALLRGGLKLYGGYPSGGGNRNIASNPTILSGKLNNLTNALSNSFHVMVIAGLGSSADSVVVDGFTITEGWAARTGDKTYNGVSVNRGTGGGLCLVSNSGARGKIALRNCIFSYNKCNGGGAGMYSSNSNPIVTNCIFTANFSFADGAGMSNFASSPIVTNCIFSSNNADFDGGGMANSQSAPIITNSIFWNNNATSAGGAIYNFDSSTPAVINCIIWNNSQGIYNSTIGTNSASVSYSDVQGTGVYAGTGNINADPRFINPADPDGADNVFATADDGLNLQATSPVVNKGSNSAVPAYVATDITGAPRIQQGTVDMGAYESPYAAENCSDDNASPLITSRNTTVYLNGAGQAAIQPFDIIRSVTDNCSLDSASVRISQNSFSCADLAVSDSGVRHQAYAAGASIGNQAWRGELGMEFTVNKRIFINQLGAFDHQGNGITGTQNGGIRVAIFNRTTQTIVPGLDAIVSAQGDAFVSNYRLKNVAPVALLPGNYVLVAKGYNTSELNGNTALGIPVIAGDNGDGAISYTGFSRYGFDTENGFGYPQYSDGGPANRYLAGTFFFSVDSSKHQAYVAGTSTGIQAWRGELGMEFSVNKRITINQMGAFDHQGNGITGTQNGGIRVAIFNKATQTIVPGLDTTVRGQADAYAANHRLVNITPVTLQPGNYVVVAKGYNASELNGNSGVFTLVTAGDNADGAISYTGSSRYGFDTESGFGYPQYADNGPAYRYLAGTFVYLLADRAGSKIVTITASDSKGNTATAAALVTIKDTLGACGGAAPAVVEQVLTATGGELGSAIRLYPNPTRDRFTMQLSGMGGTKGTIEVLDVNGRVLEQRAVSFGGKTSSQTQVFNLSAQPSGVYFVRVRSEEGVKTLKVIVAR